jgi:hypothetical protein
MRFVHLWKTATGPPGRQADQAQRSRERPGFGVSPSGRRLGITSAHATGGQGGRVPFVPTDSGANPRGLRGSQDALVSDFPNAGETCRWPPHCGAVSLAARWLMKQSPLGRPLHQVCFHGVSSSCGSRTVVCLALAGINSRPAPPLTYYPWLQRPETRDLPSADGAVWPMELAHLPYKRWDLRRLRGPPRAQAAGQEEVEAPRGLRRGPLDCGTARRRCRAWGRHAKKLKRLPQAAEQPTTRMRSAAFASENARTPRTNCVAKEGVEQRKKL